jgi:hypothetical protein
MGLCHIAEYTSQDAGARVGESWMRGGENP